ncbi:MAG TPA: dockerin type I domain-containing protein [Dehalococcoidia bacterium]|nr:dockerin type I domain-containing protein [Dehalococcoidia bacterium]
MFFGWGGACSGVGGCTVTLNGDRAVSALYNFIGDLNSDGYVGCADEAILKAHYGQPGNVLDGDLNGDGVVNVYDLSIMESHWNPPPSDPNPCPS